MTDHGSANEPDLWANTGNQPSVPPPVPPPASPTGDADVANDATTVQPATASAPEPTVVQPITPGPLSAPGAAAAAAAPGYVTGPGSPPPPTPPTQPPTGGPGGPGGPGGANGPGGERPAWVVPTAIGIGVAVLGAGLIFALTRGDDGDDAVSTDVSSTTSILADTTTIPETTVVVETTVAAETTVSPDTTIVDTTVATTVAPTTAAPTTEAPTTEAPSTDPPTTDAPSGITPAEPGQALIAGTSFDLARACVTNPVAGYSVRSYVALDGTGPLVIEEGNDEGNAFGLYSESGNAIETGEYVELGDGFGMLAFQGDGNFEVAVDPGDIAVNDCSTTGTARTSAPEAPEFGYTYGFVDMCATTDPFRAIAYLSEGGTLRIADNGDGTAQITLNTPNLFDASDAAATLTANGSRLTINGQVSGATIDGDTTQLLDVDLDSAAARGCTSAESP